MPIRGFLIQTWSIPLEALLLIKMQSVKNSQYSKINVPNTLQMTTWQGRFDWIVICAMLNCQYQIRVTTIAHEGQMTMAYTKIKECNNVGI